MRLRRCSTRAKAIVAKNVPLTVLWRRDPKPEGFATVPFRETHQENQNTGNSSIRRFPVIVFRAASGLQAGLCPLCRPGRGWSDWAHEVVPQVSNCKSGTASRSASTVVGRQFRSTLGGRKRGRFIFLAWKQFPANKCGYGSDAAVPTLVSKGPSMGRLLAATGVTAIGDSAA